MSTVIEEENYLKPPDGVELYTKTWIPDAGQSKSRALLVYTHGIESHTGWFAETGFHLAESGHPVVSLDRRGCGRSGGDSSHMDSYLQILDDLEDFVRVQQGRWPGRRTVAIGLSLGGLFMTALAMRRQRLLDGVVSMVPAIASQLGFPPQKVLVMLVASALKPHKLYPIPIKLDMFTAQPEALEFIRDDPLHMKNASARFFWSLLCMRKWVTGHQEKMKTPLLTLMAEYDEIVDNQGIREWFEKVSVTPSEIIEYPGVKHSILFEPCRNRVLEDIESFVRRVETL